MKNVTLLTLGGCLSLCLGAEAASIRGDIGLDTYYFTDEPTFTDQDDRNLVLSGYTNIEGAYDIGDSLLFDVDLFARYSPESDDTFRGDIRQAEFSIQTRQADFRLGNLYETWGLLEAWNPVDIINQKDMQEDFQGEAKLGQPGGAITLHLSGNVFTFYLMPYGRERRFAEDDDRLRTLSAPVLDSHFENGQSSPSGAFRAQFFFDKFDLSFSQFFGHDREPIFTPVIDENRLVGFDANYEKIGQTSLELQYVVGDSVLKGEFDYRDTQQGDSLGGGIGAETTYYRVGGEFPSLTLYAEYYYDNRTDESAVTPFQRDLYLGARYNLNDPSDTLFEVRYTHDLEWESDLIDLRATRRLTSNSVLSAQLLLPQNTQEDIALNGLDGDKYVMFTWDWYF